MHSHAYALPITVALFSAAAPATVWAEGQFTIGLGAANSSAFYVGEGRTSGIFPFLSYENGPFQIGFDGIRYGFDTTDNVTLSVGLAPRGRPDFPDTALFRGLDRDDTAEALVALEYRLSPGTGLALSAQTDILGEHDGTEVSAAFVAGHPLGPVMLEMQTGFTWRSAGLNDYLVGVSAAEATAQRAAYAPGATTSPFVSVSATYPMSDTMALIGNLSFAHLGDAYRDSPLVGRRSTTSASFGVVVSF
ncbi:MAG: MipA/OmpV family protein [Pseudomonadota bacterium]